MGDIIFILKRKMGGGASAITKKLHERELIREVSANYCFDVWPRTHEDFLKYNTSDLHFKFWKIGKTSVQVELTGADTIVPINKGFMENLEKANVEYRYITGEFIFLKEINNEAITKNAWYNSLWLTRTGGQSCLGTGYNITKWKKTADGWRV